jgi:hypothetical protein
MEKNISHQEAKMESKELSAEDYYKWSHTKNPISTALRIEFEKQHYDVGQDHKRIAYIDWLEQKYIELKEKKDG